VQAGAKVYAYPGKDFILSAPEGGVTVVQVLPPSQVRKAHAKPK